MRRRRRRRRRRKKKVLGYANMTKAGENKNIGESV